MIPISSHKFRAICRAAGWLLLVAIIAVTVSPITERPVSGFAPGFERAGAFLTMGLFFGLGYSRRWMLTLCMVAASGFGIEALQFLTPDRHPALADALVKTSGGTVGALLGFAFQRRFLQGLHKRAWLAADTMLPVAVRTSFDIARSDARRRPTSL